MARRSGNVARNPACFVTRARPRFFPNSNGSIAVELYFVLPSRTFGSLSAVKQSIG